MVGVRNRGETIRQFIVAHVEEHAGDIVTVTAEQFGISRQAVNGHIRRLVNQNLLVGEGNTRNRIYKLQLQLKIEKIYSLQGLREDVAWREFIRPNLGDLPANVEDIWHYGFTEMLNNAIDHSQGTQAFIHLVKNAAFTDLFIQDDGEGIFRRIQRMMGLEDERHAVLELAKGKLTTDPENHSGEGIFFSSRVFDWFAILSGGVYFSHQYNEPEDWITEHNPPSSGTTVVMRLQHHATQTMEAVFDQFASGEDFTFNTTVVPVSLARYGQESLISRSQAKRLLARVERFQVVILDFSAIDHIGQAFADEVFRVFQNRHPELRIVPDNTCPEVDKMIQRALRANP